MTTPSTDQIEIHGSIDATDAPTHGKSVATLREPRTPAIASAGDIGGTSARSVLLEAIAKGHAPEQLEKMVDLYERMEARDAARAFFEALATFQAECPQIEKTKKADVTSTRTATKWNFMYAPLDETVETIRPYLQKNGLSYTWDSDTSTPGKMKVTCWIRHIAGHREPSSMTIPTENAAPMSPQQKEGSAYTFAQRRTLWAGLGIVATDSEDPQIEQAIKLITEDQVTEILDLMTEAKIDGPKLLAHLGVTGIEQLPATKYQQVVGVLKQRIANRGQRAPAELPGGEQ